MMRILGQGRAGHSNSIKQTFTERLPSVATGGVGDTEKSDMEPLGGIHMEATCVGYTSGVSSV